MPIPGVSLPVAAAGGAAAVIGWRRYREDTLSPAAGVSTNAPIHDRQRLQAEQSPRPSEKELQLEQQVQSLSSANEELQKIAEAEKAARKVEEVKASEVQKRLDECLKQLAEQVTASEAKEVVLLKQVEAERQQMQKLNVAFREEHCILQQRWAAEESKRREVEKEQERAASEESRHKELIKDLQQKLTAEEARRRDAEKSLTSAMEKCRKAQRDHCLALQELVTEGSKRKQAEEQAASLSTQLQELKRSQANDSEGPAPQPSPTNGQTSALKSRKLLDVKVPAVQPEAAGQPTGEGMERSSSTLSAAADSKRKSLDGSQMVAGEHGDWTYDASDFQEGINGGSAGPRIIAMPSPSATRNHILHLGSSELHAGREQTDPLPRRSQELLGRLELLARQQTTVSPLPSARSDRLDGQPLTTARGVPRVIPPRDTMVYAGAAEHSFSTQPAAAEPRRSRGEVASGSVVIAPSEGNELDEFAGDISTPASRENTGNSEIRGPLVGTIPASSSTSKNSLAWRNRTAVPLVSPGLAELHRRSSGSGIAEYTTNASLEQDQRDEAGSIQSARSSSAKLWSSNAVSSVSSPVRKSHELRDERVRVSLGHAASPQDALADIPIREYSAPITVSMSRSPAQAAREFPARELSAPLPVAATVARSAQVSFLRPSTSAGSAVKVLGASDGATFTGPARTQYIHTSPSGGRLSTGATLQM
mmetsp:Transcript_32080/g.75276  ORF Transcript_32080/g.75276 Transcript_32080/m.75276 type:complete len:707 (-) Transcript_32080:89-2209(-)